MRLVTVALGIVGIIFLVVAALTFAIVPVTALFLAGIGFCLLVPEAVIDLGIHGVAITVPAAFVLLVAAVVLQSLASHPIH